MRVDRDYIFFFSVYVFLAYLQYSPGIEFIICVSRDSVADN